MIENSLLSVVEGAALQLDGISFSFAFKRFIIDELINARVALNKYLSMSISLNELMPLVIGQWTGGAAKKEKQYKLQNNFHL